MKNKKLLGIIIIAVVLVASLAIFIISKKVEIPIIGGNKNQNTSESKDYSGVKFSFITSNNANTVALDTDGNVWSMYNNKSPQKININAKIASVDAGEHYTVALDTDGNVWTWGKNQSGQLGNGTTTDNDTPQKVLGNVAMISTGQNAVLAITKNNELYSWGSGLYHKLPKNNSNDTENYLVPTKYESDIKFAYAECGDSNGGMVMDVDGNRYVWGTYTFALGVEPAQVGAESDVIPYIPKKVANDTIKFKNIQLFYNASFAIDDNGNLYGAGGKDTALGFAHDGKVVSKYAQIVRDTKFKEISCVQQKYCMSLDADGNIWAWGEKNDITTKQSDEAFKLTNDKKYKSIAFNNFSNKTAYAIGEDGNLYSWGESKGSTPTIVKVDN